MSEDFTTRPSLLIRVRDREDAASWEEFVAIYGPLIKRFARSRGIQRDTVSDVTQDVLRNVARAMQSFDYDRGKGKFRSWLFTIVRREVIRTVKKHERPGNPNSDAPEELLNQLPSAGETTLWEKDYQKQILRWAMKKVQPEFSEKAWQAFSLLALKDCSAKEVAQQLDTSPGSVYVLKSRVLKRIVQAVRSIDEDAWELEMVKAAKGESLT